MLVEGRNKDTRPTFMWFSYASMRRLINSSLGTVLLDLKYKKMSLLPVLIQNNDFASNAFVDSWPSEAIRFSRTVTNWLICCGKLRAFCLERDRYEYIFRRWNDQNFLLTLLWEMIIEHILQKIVVKRLTSCKPVTSRRPEPPEAKLTPRYIPNWRPCFRLQRNRKGGGLLLYPKSLAAVRKCKILH